MHREDGLGENVIGGADHGLKEPLVRIGACALGDLDNERSLAIDATTEKSHDLFSVIDIVSTDCVFAVSVLKQHFGRNDHFRSHFLNL